MVSRTSLQASAVRCLCVGLLFLVGLANAHEGMPGGGSSAMERHWQDRLRHGGGIAISVAADAHGSLWLLRAEQGHLWVSRSADGGVSFATPVRVNEAPEAILADGQNRPRIVVTGGAMTVLWAQATPKLHTGHIRMARSVDGGQTFSAVRTVNDNRAEIGHSFGTIAADADGRLAIAWIDARERVAARAAGRGYKGSAIYYTRSDDGGTTWSANRKLADHSCECCRIGLDFGLQGEAFAFWRHVFGSNTRDFAIAALVSGSKPVRASTDQWEIAACPHHGGDLSIDRLGRRHMVWFTGSPQRPGLFYRNQSGERMSNPLPFGNPDHQAGYPAVRALGDAVYIAWREFDGQRYTVQTMQSADRGASWSQPQQRGESAGAADIPVFVHGGDKPLLAWHTATGVRIINVGGGS